MKSSRFPKGMPKTENLYQPVFTALKNLGGSGTNDEILSEVIRLGKYSDTVVDFPHLGSLSQTELSYRCAWVKTYLKQYGIVNNSAHSVWCITPDYATAEAIDVAAVIAFISNKRKSKNKISMLNTNSDVTDSPNDGISLSDNDPSNDDVEFPDEVKPWRERLSQAIQQMDPFAFERLTQRLLRECGFTQVEVTKKSGDGGIDGIGKLRINGIFSFNVAFQCKRYKGSVGAPEVREFRGSLPTNIEKGILITTGNFTKAAREDAANPSKHQIDLIDGEEFINKIVEYGIGVKPVTIYEIDEEFFKSV